MKVGIIGGGNIASIHGSIIVGRPNTQLVGIADKNLVQARALASRLKSGECYQDALTMIEEQRPDVVHILTPPHSHAELSILAMDRGCHVLVEKPMALRLDEARRMSEAARRNGVILCANHNLLLQRATQQTRALIDNGTIGEVISVDVSYQFNPSRVAALVEEGAEHVHWIYRLNGGPLQDFMPHPASLLMMFLPKLDTVQHISHRRGVLPAPWPDELKVLVQGGDVLGYLSLSLSERPDLITVTVKGRNGMIHANLFNDIVTVQTKSGLPRAVSRGLSGFQLSGQNLAGAVGNIYAFARGQLDKTSGLTEVVHQLYAAIERSAAPPIAPEMGERVVELIERIWPEPVAAPERIAPPMIGRAASKPATVLVTGASGFIGTHLLQRLQQEGLGVRVLVRPNSIHGGRLRNLDVDVVEGDLSDAAVVRAATQGIQTIYHAGATLSNDWAEHERTNIQGTRHLLDAALAEGVERFLYVSTIAVYGLEQIRPNMVITETAPYHSDPKSMGPYYYSKTEGEKMALEAYRRHGLGVSVVRPGLVIGPRGRVHFQQLGYKYQDRLFLMIGRGTHRLPLTYVENTVVAMYHVATDRRAIGQIYNLVDNSDVTAEEYLARLISATGMQARVVKLPYLLPYAATGAYEVGATFGALKKGVTSRAQLRWKQAPVIFDGSKLRAELGWKPPVCIDEGLRRTFDWYACQRKRA